MTQVSVLTPLERFEKSVFFYCDITIDLCQPHCELG